jgi:hypothetical protein
MVDDSKKKAGGTTQRVDFETLSRIKSINYHLYKTKGVRISQAELINWAVRFAIKQEADFIEYVSSAKEDSNDSTFDTIVKVTGKPWFPYGNLVKLE